MKKIQIAAELAQYHGYEYIASIVKTHYATTYYNVNSIDDVITSGWTPAPRHYHGYRLGVSRLPEKTILRRDAFRLVDQRDEIDRLINAIHGADSLDDLCDALNAVDQYDLDHPYDPDILDRIDLSSLRTYGGDAPDDTSEIFSWDPEHYLVQCSGSWVLYFRWLLDDQDEIWA